MVNKNNRIILYTIIVLVVVLIIIPKTETGLIFGNIRIPLFLVSGVCTVAILYQSIKGIKRNMKEKKYIRIIILTILNICLVIYFIYNAFKYAS
jgi:hypothetical protein